MDKGANPPLAIFDYDSIIYVYGFANERRSVKFTHKASGKSMTAKSRTEFWGRGNKIGGKLGEINSDMVEWGLPEYSKDDFIVEDFRESNPVGYIINDIKKGIATSKEDIGAVDHIGYVGGSESFRLFESNMSKYKGNRDKSVKPIYFDEIKKYLLKHQNGILVEDNLEADDYVIIKAIETGGVVVGEDKDSWGCPVRVYNPSKREEGVVDCRGFGDIWISDNKSKNVVGRGRKWFYFQVAYGDPVDNYFAHAQSEVKHGEKSAYNVIKDCKDDKECLEALVALYKRLYPEGKGYTTWRGEEAYIDWKIALEEIWNMARMRKKLNDNFTATQALDYFGIEYDKD